MDEKPDQIIGHIEAQRDQLGRNLNELEEKVRRTTDWRTYFDRNPMLVLGAAMGGGLFLGTVAGGRRHNGRRHGLAQESSSWKSDASSFKPEPSRETWKAPSAQPPAAKPSHFKSGGAKAAVASLAGLAGSGHMKEVTNAVDEVKGALVAFGITKMKEFLGEVVPGLRQHLHLDTDEVPQKGRVYRSQQTESNPEQYAPNT
jgi:hypothetical protein